MGTYRWVNNLLVDNTTTSDEFPVANATGAQIIPQENGTWQQAIVAQQRATRIQFVRQAIMQLLLSFYLEDIKKERQIKKLKEENCQIRQNIADKLTIALEEINTIHAMYVSDKKVMGEWLFHHNGYIKDKYRTALEAWESKWESIITKGSLICFNRNTPGHVRYTLDDITAIKQQINYQYVPNPIILYLSALVYFCKSLFGFNPMANLKPAATVCDINSTTLTAIQERTGTEERQNESPAVYQPVFTTLYRQATGNNNDVQERGYYRLGVRP